MRPTAPKFAVELLEDRTVPTYVPLGPEVLVNSFTTGNQQFTAVAMDADGDFVAVWTSYGQSAGGDIYAQRYNSSGTAVGSEFKVNSYTTGAQITPDVAMDNNGNFVVVWADKQNRDGDGDSVWGQRYNSSGVAQGSNFQVNTYTGYNQNDPSVAMDADGDFVVSWSSGTDQIFTSPQEGLNKFYGVYAQRYNASGVKQGGEIHVNTEDEIFQGLSSVAMEDNGDFVVTWSSLYQDTSDSSGVYAQRFSASGSKIASEFRVNVTVAGQQFNSEIAMDSDGDFVIIWASDQSGGVNNTYARRYNNAGTAQGGEFRVNSYTTGQQYLANVAMDSDGDFVVAWSSGAKASPVPTPAEQQDGSLYGVYAQRYLANGSTDGGEFRVNTYTTNSQFFPAIATEDNGDFVIAWSSFGQDQAGSYGNYMKRYALNTAPSVNPGGPYSVTEGTSLVLSAAGSDPDYGQTLTYSWDVNNDGIYGDATGANPTLTWSQLVALGINDGSSGWLVRVRATDGIDTTTSFAASLSVVNGIPLAGITAQSAAVRGEIVPFLFNANDPSPVDQASSFTYAIDWDGDMITDQVVVSGSTLNVDHVFATTGSYNVRVAVVDKDGGFSSVTAHNVNVSIWRTAPNVNNPSLTDLFIGGTPGYDSAFIASLQSFDPLANQDTALFINFGSLGDGAIIVPGVSGRISIYLQDGDNELFELSDTVPTPGTSMRIFSGNGADFLVMGAGQMPAEIHGGGGNDFIITSDAQDTIYGGDGDDLILAGFSPYDAGDFIDAGAGRDIVFAGGGADTIYGGAGSDMIFTSYPGGDMPGGTDQEWYSANSYDLRYDHLIGNQPGGLNDGAITPGVQHVDDDATDVVYGGDDEDWFLIDLEDGDLIVDLAVGEYVTDAP